MSDKELSSIISNGVSGTGMPAFHSLGAAEVQSLVSYVRALQGKSDVRVVPGNAANGKEIFFGKGGCSSCHAVAGQGGFLGPDLTTYGAISSSKQILDAILNSNRIVPSGYKSAAVTTRDGTRIDGVVRNEDNFSVQLQAQDGAFHFFQKSDLQKLEYSNQSLMPSNYGQRLSQDELNDLVSFLMGAIPPHDKTTSKKTPAEDDAE
jgi:cytochrome c oxidase cbb3-type subunit III